MITPQVKISVFIAFYNAEKFAERTLNSVLNQSFSDFELICVDDGSTDLTGEILCRYATKDARIKVFNKENGGIPAASFNYAIDRTRGDYVFGIGHDDELSVDALEKMYRRALDTDADCAIPDLHFYSEKAKETTRIQIGLHGDRDVTLDHIEAVTYSLDWSIHAFFLLRGDIIRKLRFHELWMNSCEYSARVFFFHCNKVVFSEGAYIYHLHDSSITKKLTIKTYDIINVDHELLKFFKKNSFKNEIVKRMEVKLLNDFSYYIWVYFRTKKQLTEREREAVLLKFKNLYAELNLQHVKIPHSFFQFSMISIGKELTSSFKRKAGSIFL